MAAPARSRRRLAGVSTTRLETFADGVFAIAATLLILNVDAQVTEGTGELGRRLVEIWPSYIAYAVSFVTIGIIWSNHHTVMAQLGRVNRTFLMLNVFLLLCVAFLPFPTRLVAEHLRDRAELEPAALAYGATMTVMSVCYLSLWLYAIRGRRLLRDDSDPRTVSGITRSYLPGTPLYLTATLLALVSPLASVAFFGAIALFYVLESSIFGGTTA
jgi:TMEM175 potassium channel family protein